MTKKIIWNGIEREIIGDKVKNNNGGYVKNEAKKKAILKKANMTKKEKEAKAKKERKRIRNI